MSDKIEVQLKKARLVKLLVLMSLFIIPGVWILVDPRIMEFLPGYLNNIKFASPFFVLPVIFGWPYFVKLFDKRAALVIDETGITDNSPDLSLGLIPWKDIRGFSILKKNGRELLLIDVLDPQSYIKRQKGNFKRKQMEYFLKNQGAAIFISNRLLDCDMYWLQTTVEHRRSKAAGYQ